MQQIFYDDLMLRVTRLTDPPRMGKNENLTVGLLNTLPEVQSNQALSTRVKQKVDAAIQFAEPCRKYRHKQIGHLDLQCEIQAARAKPIQRAGMVQVKEALDAIHSCLNAVTKQLRNAELFNLPPDSARSEVFVHNSTYLAEAVQIVDCLIDPTNQFETTDHDATVELLKKLNRPATWENKGKIILLRKLALAFNAEDE